MPMSLLAAPRNSGHAFVLAGGGFSLGVCSRTPKRFSTGQRSHIVSAQAPARCLHRHARTRKQAAPTPMVRLDAVLEADRQPRRLVDGKWVDKGRVVAEPLPAAKRLADKPIPSGSRSLVRSEIPTQHPGRGLLVREAELAP